MIFSRGELSRVPAVPLTVIGLGLALAAIPLLDKVDAWAAVVLGAAILFRLMVNPLGWRLPSGPVRLLVMAAGTGGVFASSGVEMGIELFLGLLLVLLSLKLLETNSLRDFQVLVLLGWFLCLCGLSFSQDLGTWLYLSVVAFLVGVALLRCYRAPSRRGMAGAAWLALRMLVQAAPVVVLLFLFFPRLRGDFRIQFWRQPGGVTGMSDRLSPGSVSRLARDESVAFRAEFPEGGIPPASQLYWRAAVLWRGDGFTWSRGSPDMRAEERTGKVKGTVILQQIFLKPHGGRWLPALDWPTGTPRDATFEAGAFLQSRRQIVAPLVYSVASSSEFQGTGLLPEQRIEALRKPARVDPRVQALADSWRAGASGDQEIVEAAHRYFRQGKFVYSIEPGAYGADGLPEFLFGRRAGFCEHYAAAFATLMRIAGVPARVVVGYQGGEEGRGGYLIVKQLDAHAWAEVWLKGEGWHRVDLTTVIAPNRIISGSESFLATQADAAGGPAGGASETSRFHALLREGRLLWDNLNYKWDLRIVSFNDESRRAMITLAGLERFTPPVVVLWLVLGIVAVLGVTGLWLGRRRVGNPDPLVREYRRFCRRVESAGLRRGECEGPRDFSERAARAFPAQADGIREVIEFYIAARYACEPDAAGAFRRAARALVVPRKPGNPPKLTTEHVR